MDTAEVNPLATPYALGVVPQSSLDYLYGIRQWDTDIHGAVPFKWPTRLKRDYTDEKDGLVKPLVLREYQKQMIAHLVRVPFFINGDSVGTGKTISAIAAMCRLLDVELNLKFIVFATKSTIYQWQDEIVKFSELRPFVMIDEYRGLKSYNARLQQMSDFLCGKKRDVLICKYGSLLGKRRIEKAAFDAEGNPVRQGSKERTSREVKQLTQIMKQHGGNAVLIFDEAHRFFKTPGTQTRTMVVNLARNARMAWGMSATVIKNDLSEFYSIASALGIRPFGNMEQFSERFCIWRNQYIGRGRKKRVIAGYQNVAEFKEGLRPFFLGRSQRQIKENLPVLTTIYHPVEMDAEQKRLLLEDIPSGTANLPPSIVRVAGELVAKERDLNNDMSLLAIHSLATNSPALLWRYDDQSKFLSKKLSPKEEALLDLLDGDLAGEKVVIFTRYRSHIDRLEGLTKIGALSPRKFLRITGNENAKKRDEAKRLFQESPEYDTIYINSAGIEGLNLQSAAHLVALDEPWSWGDLLQMVGRIQRMGSAHSANTLHILYVRDSIDEFVLDKLRSKKGVFEAILGQSHSAGLLENTDGIDIESGMEQAGTDEEFLHMMRAYAHGSKRLGKIIHRSSPQSQLSQDWL